MCNPIRKCIIIINNNCDVDVMLSDNNVDVLSCWYRDTLLTSAVLERTNKIQTVWLKDALEKYFLKDF